MANFTKASDTVDEHSEYNRGKLIMYIRTHVQRWIAELGGFFPFAFQGFFEKFALIKECAVLVLRYTHRWPFMRLFL